MMNERLRELAAEAYRRVHPGPDTYGEADAVWMGFDELEKVFAELIVRECAELCEGEAIFAGMNGRKDASASNCATIIRKHFGVEE